MISFPVTLIAFPRRPHAESPSRCPSSRPRRRARRRVFKATAARGVETEIHAGPRAVLWGGKYIFLENGQIQFVRTNIDKPKSVDTGDYKIDYSKDPVQIDIAWRNGKSEVGIIRFIGEEKNLMEIELAAPGSNERPIGFGRDTMLLTKKVKK